MLAAGQQLCFGREYSLVGYHIDYTGSCPLSFHTIVTLHWTLFQNTAELRLLSLTHINHCVD